MIYDDELYANEDMWDDEYDYDPYTNYWYEEAEEIYAKIDEMLNKAMTPSPMEKPKIQPKLKPEFAVTEVKPTPKAEPPKPKVMSDFEILTADVESI